MKTSESPDKTPTERADSHRLRQMLRRADYATTEMRPSGGTDNHEQVLIIRRMHAATIASDHYPRTRRHSLGSNATSLAVWENEGGGIRGTPSRDPLKTR